MPRTIGIIDGGQLGGMTCEAAHRMGLDTVVLTNDKDGCAIPVARKAIVGSYGNVQVLREFARRVGNAGVVTTAFENVPVGALSFLEHLRKSRRPFVRPSSGALGVAQHRLREKDLARALGIPTTNYISMHKLPPTDELCRRFLPGFLKTCRLGYDGKNQRYVTSRAEALAAFHDAGTECELEQAIEFAYEISVIVARKRNGEVLVFPPVKNTHRDGILRETHYAEGLIPEAVKECAIKATMQLARYLRVVGLLTVEFFVTKDGRVLFNEMAPRPHNSGHWTIEGCETSQFTALIQAVLGLQFTPVRPVSEAMMVNFIGDEISEIGKYAADGWVVHNYGKDTIRAGRKQGHATKIIRSERIAA